MKMQNQTPNNNLQDQDTLTWNTWMKVMNAGQPNVEPGDYEAVLTDAIASRSTASNRPQVDVEYEIPSIGKTVHSYFVLDIEKGVQHLKRWATILGHRPPSDPRDLSSFLRQISERQYRVLIRVIDNDGFAFALLLEKLEGQSEVIQPPPLPTGVFGNAVTVPQLTI